MNMKKIYIVLAGLAVVLGSACCNKIEDGKDVMSQDVTIDINVAELNPSTKAIKSGWANGDIINVYLSDATSYVPDFTLTYNDEKWTASAMTDAVKSRLQASGRIKGFWEARIPLLQLVVTGIGLIPTSILIMNMKILLVLKIICQQISMSNILILKAS